uniref:type I polyketide synthase n=2 Tax=Nocardia amikacinitolerans TaxID=756689 RepID=UPI0012EDB615
MVDRIELNTGGNLIADQAVAIIGLSCRLPEAPNPEAFWRMLISGRDAVGPVPRDRFADAPTDGPGARGAFIENVDGFDPGFFGISPREAEAMDPQQRLMLELSWEALEDAGIIPSDLSDGDVGVFVGAIWDDYATLLQRSRGAASRYVFTGVQRGMIANRVSYSLGLRGPSMTIDTAQSSSLVAVHTACESLHRGEAKLALAGGINLNISSESTARSVNFGGLSPDGRCYTFDARANGYVRGEGGVVVVLKPLTDALADGDPIYCVIRGTAINNDGATTGLTVPSAKGQSRVIRDACARAGVSPGRIQYVELHGTGTAVGDPIEATALGEALCEDRSPAAPLLVGSVKTNIGHLEGAAGIAGLLKTVLSIKHRALPPSLNFERPNPNIDFDALGLRVQDRLGAWPRSELIAGVSSFGIGGTNCHVILSESPVTQQPVHGQRGARHVQSPIPWVLSGRTSTALRAQASRLLDSLQDRVNKPVDVGWSLATTRTAFEHRAVIVGADETDMLSRLRALASGHDVPGIVRGAQDARTTRAVFVFPGQGSQWPGMALGLFERSTTFRDAFIACDTALRKYVDWSLFDVLQGRPTAPSLDKVDVVQPMLFAVMVSLARLWESFGLRPSAVIGHSQGEIAAAHIAGALSLDDAARVVAVRSNALTAVAGHGGMASVALSVDAVTALLDQWPGRLDIAAENGPAATVVSGESTAIDELLAECTVQGVSARKIPVDYASHSVQVEPIRTRLLGELASITPRRSEIPFYSTVTATVLDTELLDGDYWYRNLRMRVQFASAIRQLGGSGHQTFIECSPHGVLVLPIQETLDDALVVGSLRRDEDSWLSYLGALAQVYVYGATVDWSRAFPSTAHRIQLPAYAFQREQYWPQLTHGTPEVPAVDDVRYEPRDVSRTSTIDQESWIEQLTGLTDPEQLAVLVELIRTETAIVVGHLHADAVDPARTFKDLGIDSPAAVELRNRLTTALDRKLAPTIVFAHPTPISLAEHLRQQLLEHSDAIFAPAANAVDEPIAVVGMGCRLPGGVTSPAQLWDLVAGEVDAIGGFPEDRGWNLEDLFDSDPDMIGKSYTRHGGFLYDADGFDAEFFGISPREALALDPQQRLLLEVAWEAFENAGINPTTLHGDPIGTFTG